MRTGRLSTARACVDRQVPQGLCNEDSILPARIARPTITCTGRGMVVAKVVCFAQARCFVGRSFSVGHSCIRCKSMLLATSHFGSVRVRRRCQDVKQGPSGCRIVSHTSWALAAQMLEFARVTIGLCCTKMYRAQLLDVVAWLRSRPMLCQRLSASSCRAPRSASCVLRARQAQQGELVNALAVWGLPREARYPDRIQWWEEAPEQVVRRILAEDLDVARPESVAECSCKEGRECGWPRLIETNADEHKKALRAATHVP